MTYPVIYDKRDGSGFYIDGVAGEALGDRKLVYIDSSGLWRLADADTAARMTVIGITIGAIPAGKWGRILTDGFIGLSTWIWTVGEVVYASDVAGELSQTMLGTASNVVQEIGYALTATQISFKPRLGRGITGPTYTKHIHADTGTFKIPAAAAPDINVQDNTVMYGFNQNDSESAYMTWVVPADYAGGDLTIEIHWTNAGGVGDNGNHVRWEVNYQTIVSPGGSIAGDHANSPILLNDTYTSATGHLEHTTAVTTIAAADFAAAHHVHIRLTALVPAVTAITGDAQFIEMMLSYTAYIDV